MEIDGLRTSYGCRKDDTCPRAHENLTLNVQQELVLCNLIKTRHDFGTCGITREDSEPYYSELWLCYTGNLRFEKDRTSTFKAGSKKHSFRPTRLCISFQKRTAHFQESFVQLHVGADVSMLEFYTTLKINYSKT